MSPVSALLTAHGRNLPVYHLSHIDLDGYGAQFITRRIFQRIEMANSDYGAGILDQFQVLIERYRKYSAPALFLITDLNLTPAQAQAITERLDPFSEAGLLLLDHHDTGAKTASRFPWYHLDTQHSATQLTYNAFETLLRGDLPAQQFLQSFAAQVDAYDLWQEANPLFACGNLFSDQILDLRDILPESLSDLTRDYRHFILEGLLERRLRGSSLRDLERMVPDLREAFLTAHAAELPPGLLDDAERTLANKFYHLVAAQVHARWAEQVRIVTVDGRRGALVYGWPKSIYQTVSNLLLAQHTDLDFFSNAVPTGYLSFRSRGVKVSDIASRYFGGGGHPFSCGGSLNRAVPNLEQAWKLFESRVHVSQTGT